MHELGYECDFDQLDYHCWKWIELFYIKLWPHGRHLESQGDSDYHETFLEMTAHLIRASKALDLNPQPLEFIEEGGLDLLELEDPPLEELTRAGDFVKCLERIAAFATIEPSVVIEPITQVQAEATIPSEHRTIEMPKTRAAYLLGLGRDANNARNKLNRKIDRGEIKCLPTGSSNFWIFDVRQFPKACRHTIHTNPHDSEENPH